MGLNPFRVIGHYFFNAFQYSARTAEYGKALKSMGKKIGNELKVQVWRPKITLFQPRVKFHLETSQMTGFYMKCNIGLKWVIEIVNRKTETNL